MSLIINQDGNTTWLNRNAFLGCGMYDLDAEGLHKLERDMAVLVIEEHEDGGRTRQSGICVGRRD